MKWQSGWVYFQNLAIMPKPAAMASSSALQLYGHCMQPFDFLLLDEPYSHLDDANRQKATELIYEECKKRDAAMVFADLKKLDFLKGEKVLML